MGEMGGRYAYLYTQTEETFYSLTGYLARKKTILISAFSCEIFSLYKISTISFKAKFIEATLETLNP